MNVEKIKREVAYLKRDLDDFIELIDEGYKDSLLLPVELLTVRVNCIRISIGLPKVEETE
jgi:hypothetical protein|tara:strand:- start:260 stop:439 length:180 start_codon:yes stop_codon:yes gene_type:complete